MNFVMPRNDQVTRNEPLDFDPCGTKLYAAAICCMAAVIMLPVLLFPHWGMFSDRNQIVLWCQHARLAPDPWWWLNESIADLRPIAHWLDYTIWLISPNSPWSFYFVRTVLFVATVGITYLNCLRLSRDSLISFLVSLFWFLSLPTYEVVYTLDKGELLIAMMAASSLWFDLESIFGQARFDLLHKRAFKLGLIALIMTLAMLTKQTGQLLICYALTAAAVRFGFWHVCRRDSASVTAAVDVSMLLRWSTLYALVAAVAWCAYEAFYIGNGGLTHHYYKAVEYSLGPLTERMRNYLVGMPEFCILLVSSLVLILFRIRRQGINPELAVPISLFLTTIAGAIGLSTWRGSIVYGWFPLLAFMLPLVAYAFRSGTRFNRPLAALLTVAGVFLFAPGRIEDAQLQFQMDAVFNDLIMECLNLSRNNSGPSTFILPFDNPSSFEIGNVLRVGLHMGAAKSKASAPLAALPRVANMIDFALPRDGDGSLATNLLTSYKPGLQKHFLGQSDEQSIESVRVGDVLVVPSGNVAAKAAEYRGIPMFYKDWREWTGWLGTLGLEPKFCVAREIRRVGLPSMNMQWVGLKVTRSLPLSLATSDGGWVFDGAKLIADECLNGQVLTIKTRNSHRLQQLRIIGKGEESTVSARNLGDHSYWDISLGHGPQSLAALFAHEKPLFLIQDMSVHPAAPRPNERQY